MGIFSIFKRKITMDQACDAIRELSQDPSNETEHVIMMRAHASRRGDFNMVDGCIAGNPGVLAKMMTEVCKNDPDFSKSLITCAESVKMHRPEMMEFSNGLLAASADYTEKSVKGLKRELSDKFPGAEILSVDLKSLDDMDSSEFKNLIDKIYKSTKNNNESRSD